MAIDNNCDSLGFEHGGNIAEEAQRLGLEAYELLDASASLAPFSPQKAINQCILKAIENMGLKNYPDRNLYNLKEAIASWHKVKTSMVLPGNGAAELMTWAGRDAVNTGLSILPNPGFADYQRAINCWGGTYKQSSLPLRWNSSFPQSFPIKEISEVIWITNPHNPTGQLWDRNSLEKLTKTYKLVICDEAFLPLVPEGEKQSLIPLTTKYENLIVIRSLTKLFSIAGLRIGYVISAPERLKKWENLRDPWPMNSLAIAVGERLMKDTSLYKRHIQQIHQWIIGEGSWLHSHLNTLTGIKAHPSSTNFFLIESNTSLLPLREHLAQKKILLRDCRSFEGLGENWLRISLQNESNNQRIFNAIKSFTS
ncbi:aminotransferase class I/II-fold pyridoxal phosphate-dependent enzyme [Prochlorococcus sp. MIT 0601]|uniref:pyridoxal phosphate-dependent aminotransferase n=1 Tax=Prochlorococcus sp. MIT 0601 TaxID=1499498 RepID=UPI000533B659|nr:aminotransferase class I/II-fold pyridoxal phosphate-dependent enzyme [Prochlorococcus sp. MIT 0601]KGG13173.1 L-threonine 3-O-phosphate decarboxylase [Prochlorococcus sp. MIT 0601]